MREFGGWRNQVTYDAIAYLDNVEPVYRYVQQYARLCLERVPGMTPQTLGLNILNTLGDLIDQAQSGSYVIKAHGWGSEIVVDPGHVRLFADLGTLVGDAWREINETELGDAWLETMEGVPT